MGRRRPSTEAPFCEAVDPAANLEHKTATAATSVFLGEKTKFEPFGAVC